ncbi:hypothetical protein [Photobacterium minamisatsumaniensis]|uniref:hypothetical protein n=1 Tax=Photobacterium minamisatsumaniensis TaxID=2910233 RepID=UPI003D14E7D8
MSKTKLIFYACADMRKQEAYRPRYTIKTLENKALAYISSQNTDEQDHFSTGSLQAVID